MADAFAELAAIDAKVEQVGKLIARRFLEDARAGRVPIEDPVCVFKLIEHEMRLEEKVANGRELTECEQLVLEATPLVIGEFERALDAGQVSLTVQVYLATIELRRNAAKRNLRTATARA